MAMEYFKLAFYSILCISALFWQVHLACDGDEFQKFQERVQMRTFSGSRMDLAPNTFDHEQIFSVLQCLDICLRTTHCFSVDINLDHPRKICRINPLFETRKHFLVKDENWKHVNISAKHLRKMLRSATNDCNGMERDGKTNQLILSTQAKLDSYCATEAPNLGGCKHKKAHNGSCSGKWTAKIIKTRWCCVDLTHPSQNCCCEIPI
ncbi:hypothetical protein ABFA07_018252 [Porites harrisoni]